MRRPSGDLAESGIPWLGPIPRHWQLVPFRALVDERTERNDGAKVTEYLSLMANVGVIPYEEKGDVGNKKPEDLSKCKMVQRGDLLINSMNYGIGSFGLSAYSGVCSSVYIVLRPKTDVVDVSFAHRLLQSRAFQVYAQSFGNGILAHRAAIGWNTLKSLPMPLPPIAEQTAIAAFLTREVGKIEALLGEQDLLVELLKEKRQAIVDHAVTKGLNPDVRMKPTGVEWLADVPGHWRVLPLRRLIRSIDQGWSPQAYDREPADGEPSVLRLSAIKDGHFRPEQRKALPDLRLEDLHDALLVKAGDLLLTRANTPLLVGDCAIATEVSDTIFSDLIYRLRVDELEALPSYLLYTLRSSGLRGQVRRDARGASMTMAKIAHGHIKSWVAAIPPLEEQRMIVDHLEMELETLADVQQEIEKSSALLHERKVALIADAVTGKLDVHIGNRVEDLVA